MEQLKPDVLANYTAEMVTCYIELMKVVLNGIFEDMPQAMGTTITNGEGLHPCCFFNNVLLLLLQLNQCTVINYLKSKSYFSLKYSWLFQNAL